MKTIEVADEMYDALMKLSKEMTSQDMRGTKMPHMFQVQTNETVAAYPGCGEEVWVNDDGDELETDEEVRLFVHQHIYENDESINHLDDEKAKQVAKERVDEMDEADLCEYLEEECNEGWRTVSVTTERRYQNTFFTAKACEEHIESNKHHYKEPICYLNHAWRNPEMDLVATFLCELSGGKLYQ